MLAPRLAPRLALQLVSQPPACAPACAPACGWHLGLPFSFWEHSVVWLNPSVYTARLSGWCSRTWGLRAAGGGAGESWHRRDVRSRVGWTAPRETATCAKTAKSEPKPESLKWRVLVGFAPDAWRTRILPQWSRAAQTKPWEEVLRVDCSWRRNTRCGVVYVSAAARGSPSPLLRALQRFADGARAPDAFDVGMFSRLTAHHLRD